MGVRTIFWSNILVLSLRTEFSTYRIAILLFGFESSKKTVRVSTIFEYFVDFRKSELHTFEKKAKGSQASRPNEDNKENVLEQVEGIADRGSWIADHGSRIAPLARVALTITIRSDPTNHHVKTLTKSTAIRSELDDTMMATDLVIHDPMFKEIATPVYNG